MAEAKNGEGKQPPEELPTSNVVGIPDRALDAAMELERRADAQAKKFAGLGLGGLLGDQTALERAGALSSDVKRAMERSNSVDIGIRRMLEESQRDLERSAAAQRDLITESMKPVFEAQRIKNEREQLVAQATVENTENTRKLTEAVVDLVENAKGADAREARRFKTRNRKTDILIAIAIVACVAGIIAVGVAIASYHHNNAPASPTVTTIVVPRITKPQ